MPALRFWLRPSPTTCRPAVERLEDRTAPAGLTVLAASPARVDGAPIDHLDVRFSGALTPTSFTPADVTLVGPGSGAVAVSAVSPLAPDLYRISLEPQTDRGTYGIGVGPDIADATGQLLDQNGNGTGGEATDVFRTTAVVTDATVTFTAPTTITETDTRFDGADLLIDGTTVTIDGPHTFNSIHLINGAVLTHTANSATQTHKLDLTLAGEVIVDATSRIDVSGRTAGNLGGSSGAAASLPASQST
jgi:hypothetical protein